MQIQLKATKIWLANEAVDFRKGANGLCQHIAEHYHKTIDGDIYIFYNQARNKLKLLAYHRNGSMLVYKALDKNKFSCQQKNAGVYEMNEQQLSWLLAGLDWMTMSEFSEISYDDYY
jgi:transposase